jgi:hypothetical protein
MGKSRRTPFPPVRHLVDSSPPEPLDKTDENPAATLALASMMREEIAAESAGRVNHVDHDDATARAHFVLGPDGVPRLADGDAEPAPLGRERVQKTKQEK